MPQGIVWTLEMDAALLTMRVARKMKWDDIGAVFGLHRQTVIARGRELNAEALAREANEADAECDDADKADDSRDPLPAGSAISWGAICADTTLAGAAYPFPVFDSPRA